MLQCGAQGVFVPIFMQFGSEGETVASAGHTDWIEIESFQWGVGCGISAPTGGSSDREGSAPSVGEIVITKPMDAASAKLVRLLLNGSKHTVHVVSGSSPSNGHDTLTLPGAVIAGIQLLGEEGSSRKKHEKVTVHFSACHVNGILNGPIPYNLFRP